MGSLVLSPFLQEGNVCEHDVCLAFEDGVFGESTVCDRFENNVSETNDFPASGQQCFCDFWECLDHPNMDDEKKVELVDTNTSQESPQLHILKGSEEKLFSTEQFDGETSMSHGSNLCPQPRLRLMCVRSHFMLLVM